mmetsp:Transcript_102556/g.316491  ORF Transcript_102556/g.316491 Transcript_102556/m.316491 type:complete len:249 (-) Transcript_102556:27-773(-)
MYLCTKCSLTFAFPASVHLTRQLFIAGVQDMFRTPLCLPMRTMTLLAVHPAAWDARWSAASGKEASRILSCDFSEILRLFAACGCGTAMAPLLLLASVRPDPPSGVLAGMPISSSGRTNLLKWALSECPRSSPRTSTACTYALNRAVCAAVRRSKQARPSPGGGRGGSRKALARQQGRDRDQFLLANWKALHWAMKKGVRTSKLLRGSLAWAGPCCESRPSSIFTGFISCRSASATGPDLCAMEAAGI